jgi:hypothetical protein
VVSSHVEGVVPSQRSSFGSVLAHVDPRAGGNVNPFDPDTPTSHVEEAGRAKARRRRRERLQRQLTEIWESWPLRAYDAPRAGCETRVDTVFLPAEDGQTVITYAHLDIYLRWSKVGGLGQKIMADVSRSPTVAAHGTLCWTWRLRKSEELGVIYRRANHGPHPPCDPPTQWRFHRTVWSHDRETLGPRCEDVYFLVYAHTVEGELSDAEVMRVFQAASAGHMAPPSGTPTSTSIDQDKD